MRSQFCRELLAALMQPREGAIYCGLQDSG
jgi:hypothetical protein